MAENEGKVEGTASVVRVEKRKRVAAPEFIRAWEETVAGLEKGTLKGVGTEIVAERLGLSQTTVAQRSSKYRTGGVALSNMPRGGGAKFNVDKANEVLAQVKASLAQPEQKEQTA